MATVSAILQKTPNYQQYLGTYNKEPGEFGFPGQLPPNIIGMSIPHYQQYLGTYNKEPGEFGFPGQLPPTVWQHIIGMSIPRRLGVYNFPQLPTNLPTSTNGTQGSEMQLPIDVIRMLPYLNTIRRRR